MARSTWQTGRMIARATIFATFVIGGLAGLIARHPGAVAMMVTGLSALP